MPERDRRFAAVVGVKDEVDILPRSIEQLRRVGVGYIIVLDFGSTDGTLEYLAEAEKTGDLWLVPRDYLPPNGVGKRATIALVRACEADWVLFLDADEILLPRTGSLHDVADIESADLLSVMRYNVVAGDRGPNLPSEIGPDTYDQLLLYAQPIPDFYHHVLREPDTPWIRGVLEPKVMLRPRALVDVHAGSHDADLTADRHWRRVVATDLIIAHAPIRSLDRFRLRAENYGKAIERRPEWYTGWQGWQWVRFAEAAKDGRVEDEFARQLVGSEELASLRSTHIVRSVEDVFATPIPSVDSEDAYRSMVGRAEPWLWAAGLVCRQEGIEPGGKIELLTGQARSPAVFIPPGLVVKFYARWADGYERARHEAETLRRLGAETLRRLGADSPLPVPRLVAEGTLEGEYRYLVMTRVPGTPLRQMEAMEGPVERDDIPAALGGFVRWLHDLPLDDAERDAEWPRFVEDVTSMRAGAVRVNRDRGLPGHLLDQLEDWLPSVEELAGSAVSAVRCHGALDASNLMGWLDGRRFVPTGVIDLGRSFFGNPLAELGAISWGALPVGPVALDTFLAAWRPPGYGKPGFPRLALAWSLLTRPDGDSIGVEDVGDLDALAERLYGVPVLAAQA